MSEHSQFAEFAELREGITLSTKGRFHFFDLARELQRSGCLRRLITSLPSWYAARFGVDARRVASLVPIEFLDRAIAKMPRGMKFGWNSQYLLSELYDLAAAARLREPGKIFVGLSSFALHSLRKARRRGARIVVERSSSHIEYQRDILIEEYERFGARPALPHPAIVEKELAEYAEADYIAVPSDFVKQTFISKGFDSGRLIHVPFGVDASAFRPLGKTDDVFRVIYCGGITVRKGVHYLIEAFSALGLPKAELMLIGSLGEESARVLGARLPPNVRHIGPFPQSELPKYYSEGSVFCMPSIEEGLAVVQLQAMACGLPVVCTTNTGGSDVVRDGIDGYVVPIRDPATIASRLSALHDDPMKLQQMSASARERVRNEFSWSDYGRRMLTAYLKVLAPRNRAGSRP